MQLPFVSVIIPNFNHAPYLQQRIETVFSQSYNNFEIILLDDCSTDNSHEIIEQYYGDERFSYIIVNENNSGSAFKQWVKGIALSKGKYIWIAESDDWCEPTFLETIMSGIVSNNNCVLGYCQSYYVHHHNNIIWQTSHKSLADFIAGDTFISNYMLSGTAIYNASMAVWKKDVFEKISKDFLQYQLCGDWLFWIEICRHGDVFVSGKILNYFRKHRDNISNKGIANGDSFIEELNMFTSLYKKGSISGEDFFKSLKSEYIHFKAEEKKLDPDKRAQIKNIFFKEAGFKTRLINYYRGFYSRYVILKLFNKYLPDRMAHQA